MIISIFNNKGGVGKTTLLYHFAHALSELGNKVLLLDIDPQCNLTINAIEEEKIHDIWEKEEPFIDDYTEAKKEHSDDEFNSLLEESRSIHFLLKPLEEDTGETLIAKPYKLTDNLDIIPGNLTLQFFEAHISRRWGEALMGKNSGLRIIKSIKDLAQKYKEEYNYDYVLIDTSPSLGDLNKIGVALSDFFFIPCSPDIYSIYGIRNIGKTLERWHQEFTVLQNVLPQNMQKKLNFQMVKLIGYVPYNLKKYSSSLNELELATGHYEHVIKLPKEIIKQIDSKFFATSGETMKEIISKKIIYSHNTFTGVAQKYHQPIWKVHDNLSKWNEEDKTTLQSKKKQYQETRPMYLAFAKEMIQRIERGTNGNR